MKATYIIERDHHAIETLFDKFKAAPPEGKETIERELFDALTVHERMEDTYFYPALEERLDDNDAVKELSREQTTLEFGTMGAKIKEAFTGPNDERIHKIMEKVLAHAHKEKEILFPLAEEYLGNEKLEELGNKMESSSAVAAQEKRDDVV